MLKKFWFEVPEQFSSGPISEIGKIRMRKITIVGTDLDDAKGHLYYQCGLFKVRYGYDGPFNASEAKFLFTTHADSDEIDGEVDLISSD